MLAGGDGRRAGQETNKVLLPLAGRRVFTWSIRWARSLSAITHTVLVIREQDRETVNRVLEREVTSPDVLVVVGGESRHASEWAALKALAGPIEANEIDVVVIHDAARPLAGPRLFADVIAAAAEHGGAIPVLEQRGLTTVEDDDSNAWREEASVAQCAVVTVQTPQAFLAGPLLAAYTQADRDGFLGTDTASCVEHYTDLPVLCVAGDPRNVKITFPEDLFVAERLLAKTGYDLTEAHRDAHPRLSALRQALWPEDRG